MSHPSELQRQVRRLKVTVARATGVRTNGPAPGTAARLEELLREYDVLFAAGRLDAGHVDPRVRGYLAGYDQLVTEGR